MILPKILKNKNYARLYYAGIASEIGSFVTETVLMLHIFNLAHQDKTYLGILRVIFLVCLTIGGILGGPIGETGDRKKILIFCEIARVPIIILLLFFQSIPAILIGVGLLAFFTGIFRPSRQSLVNEIVPQDEIKNANGLFASSNAMIHLLGPLIGASVYSAFKGISWTLIADLATYVLGIWWLSKISYQPPEYKLEKKGSFFNELIEGFKFSMSRKDILAILFNSVTAGICIGVLIPIMVPFIVEVLGKTEREYGHIMGVFGIGGMFGGSLSNYLSRFISSGKIAIITLFMEALLFFIWTKVTYYPLSLALFGFWGIIVFTRITSQLNHVSETVPTNYLSRTHSLLEMSFVIPNISGGLVLAIGGSSLDTVIILKWVSIMFLILTFVRIFSPELHALWRKKDIIKREVQSE